jgi:tRNA modification GTPase
MKITQSEDTITAIATPAGFGSISVIRISGQDAFEKTDLIFSGKTSITQANTHTIHYGKITDDSGNIIDDVLVSVFKAPNSYTGENAVEISTHGSPYILKRILELLLKHNVRFAEPGEFTKRAFLNGKLDLAQAEAVADIIMARTEVSLKGARNQLDGLLSKKVGSLRDMLINASSFVELELDFAEEGIELISYKELSSKVQKIIIEIDALLKTYSFGRVIRDGVNVALVGLPNVGKSSILNYILKESRAIVSEIPGTTRDIIREEVSIDGVLFRLFDTAGIRVSEDAIEKVGVLRSREAVRAADIVMLIADVEQGMSSELLNEIILLSSEEKVIRVMNKIDLPHENNINYDIQISALTGEGMNAFLDLLKNKALGNSTYSEKSALITNARHYNSLQKAKENLSAANESIEKQMSGEFIAVDLRNAIDNLGEIIGEVTTDDVLNNIFMKFCIGK